MRGALKPFSGIEVVDLKAGQKDFQVKYKKGTIDPEVVAQAITKAGEAVSIVK